MTSFRLRKRRQVRIIKSKEPKSVSERPKLRVVPASNDEAAQRASDGLKILEGKNKVTGRLKTAAYAYRRAYILSASEGAAIASGIGSLDSVRGHGGIVLPRVVSEADAKAKLFAYRWVACAGLPECVTVLDAICGQAKTLWDMAGGKEREAIRLEANLLMALRLIAQHLEKAIDVTHDTSLASA